MFGATLVFHVASVVFILGLLYSLMRWKQKNQRLLELLAAGSRWRAPKVAIDWPAKYLSEVCAALGIPFVAGDHAKESGPAKLKADQLMALFRQVEITQIQLGVDQPGLDIFFVGSVEPQSLPRPEVMANELSVNAVRYFPEAS